MKRLVLIIGVVFSGGCTTMQSFTTIAPYTKNRQQRDEIEAMAQGYCRDKRGPPGAPASGRGPDYLFTTDGCSRWPDDGWVACCVAHDIAYWCGGSEEDRADADLMLQDCVNQRHAFIGTVMYAGVRIAGVPWLPTPWRWGYGWQDWPHGYEPSRDPGTVAGIIRSRGIAAALDAHFKQRVDQRVWTETFRPDPGGL